MYEAKAALFLYCVSPVHMGAGTAVGLIDNPIQRERHTEWPLFAGSGLKGAARHRVWAELPEDERSRKESLLNRLFGPSAGAAELHAGAVGFGDAQLVAFPVRCTRRAYVYATSPTVLARTRRLLDALDIACPWQVPTVAEDRCLVVSQDGPVSSGERLHLEAFEYEADGAADLGAIGTWLAAHALPQDEAHAYFRGKLAADLVVLPDEDFTHFVTNATVVEPHVRINDETGSADEGGLFYTENLPPESLLVAPLMASRERRKAVNGEQFLDAAEVLKMVVQGGSGMPGLDGRLLQVGGDATTGRGQIIVTALEAQA